MNQFFPIQSLLFLQSLFLLQTNQSSSFSFCHQPPSTFRNPQPKSIRDPLNALKLYSLNTDLDNDIDEEDDLNPISQFGTRLYWDDTYIGRGDFPMDEYSWYYGWDDTIQKIWKDTVIPNLETPHHSPLDEKELKSNTHILIPGIGNDSIILDLFGSGWSYITAFDYSQYAIDRQYDLLYTPTLQQCLNDGSLQLHRMDATNLKEHEILLQENDDMKEERKMINWTDKFDIVFEKGALDAIYLSSAEDDNRVRMAVAELTRVLKKDGIFVSVSGVIPEELRREIFSTDEWKWIRDGSEDLQAGCFVWKKQ